MNVGIQIGPECIPGQGNAGSGPNVSGTARLGSESAIDGLAGNTVVAWKDGEGGVQSSWRQFIEALGLMSGETAGEGKEAAALSAPSSGKTMSGEAISGKRVPDQVPSFSLRASVLKAGNTMAAPREAPEARTDTPANRKAAGAGSVARKQAHVPRKVDGSKTTASAAAVVEPALVSRVVVSMPEIAASRVSMAPMGDSAVVKASASECRVERRSRPSMPLSSEGQLAKDSGTRPQIEGMGSLSGNVPADAKGDGLPNGKDAAAASEPELELERTEASGTSGLQERGLDLSDALRRGGTDHATTDSAIANAVAAASNHSQPVADATPPAEHHTALRSVRALEPSSEKTAHARMAPESAVGRGLSVMAAQDAGSPIPVRDQAGIGETRGRQEEWSDPVRAAAKDMSAMTGEETFARLDADSAPRSIHWVQTGPHHAEAGYLDPALGWVGVRAESSGGGVHAAVLPGSPEAAQVLGGHLGGLNAFLAQQHGPHATATLAAPQDGRYEAGAEQGRSAGGGSGRDDGAERDGARTGRESDLSLRAAASAPRAVEGSIGSDSSTVRRAGTHVSVMA
jgi:hypothetical protein